MDFHGINFNSKNGLGLLVSEKGQYIRLVDKHGDEFIKQENTAKYVKKIRLGIGKGSIGLFGERDRNYVKIVSNWIFYIIQKHNQVEYLDIIHDSSLEDMPSQHTEHVLEKSLVTAIGNLEHLKHYNVPVCPIIKMIQGALTERNIDLKTLTICLDTENYEEMIDFHVDSSRMDSVKELTVVQIGDNEMNLMHPFRLQVCISNLYENMHNLRKLKLDNSSYNLPYSPELLMTIVYDLPQVEDLYFGSFEMSKDFEWWFLEPNTECKLKRLTITLVD